MFGFFICLKTFPADNIPVITTKNKSTTLIHVKTAVARFANVFENAHKQKIIAMKPTVISFVIHEPTSSSVISGHA